MDEQTRLIEAAMDAQADAHAPYSEYHVGAAIQARDGTMFRACNIEAKPSANTLHAEQRAVAKAVEAGYGDFTALALVTNDDDVMPPCGNCRQTLATFGPELTIYVRSNGGQAQYDLSELLPHAYTGRSEDDAPTEG